MNKDYSHYYNFSNYNEMLKTNRLNTDITVFQDTIHNCYELSVLAFKYYYYQQNQCEE